MLKIENTEVYGWEAAIRGMRNPMNSWDKSDTYTVDVPDTPRLDYYGKVVEIIPAHERVIVNRKEQAWNGVGENDLDLMHRLRKAGTDHRKFMRMITVSCDVVAPLYWWKEYDTYKVGTVANSCSTMHKIHAKEFTPDDFSLEHLTGLYLQNLQNTVNMLNTARMAYLKTTDAKEKKIFWWQMIQLLPSSYNQRRTILLNYEVLANIYKSRKNHKLDEWHTFCEWIEGLPYSELITGEK